MDELGYIKLYRKLRTNPLWTQCSPAVRCVFISCLLDANWKSRSWFDGKQTVELAPGTLISSLNSLAERSGVTRKQARIALQWLKTLKIAEIHTNQRYTLIRFLNWTRYQSVNTSTEDSTHNSTEMGHTSGHSDDIAQDVDTSRLIGDALSVGAQLRAQGGHKEGTT